MVLNMLMYWIDATGYILIVLPVLVKKIPKIYEESSRFRNSSVKQSYPFLNIKPNNAF